MGIRGKVMNRLCLSVLLLSLLIATPLLAQKDFPSQLREASILLENEEADSALTIIEGYLADEPSGKYTASALLLAGRCEVRRGEGVKAVNSALSVLDRLEKDDELVPQAYYLLATAQQLRGEYYEAARALVLCLDNGAEGKIQEYSLKHLSELVKGPVSYKATSLKLLARNDGTKRILNIILPKSSEKALFGVLIPEGDAEDNPGSDLLEGVEAAVDRWESLTGDEIELIVKRIPKGSVATVNSVREMVRNLGVWGLIIGGPEAEVIAASVEAQAASIPVVLPGQRRPNLNSVGPSIVLPEANWRREGEIAAEYAVDSLALKVIGVVAPYTDRGKETVTGFLEFLEERESVEVLAQEWYFPEEGVSLSRQFQRIRTTGFKREFLDSLRQTPSLQHPDSLIAIMDTLDFQDRLLFLDSLHVNYSSVWNDSIITDMENEFYLASEELINDSSSKSMPEMDSITCYLLDSLLTKRDTLVFDNLWSEFADSVQRTIAFKTGQIDSNDIELSAYDGLYILIEPGTIPLFAPQFAFYNFKTTKIGNFGWYESDLLYRNRQYVEEMIFTSPYYVEESSGEMGELALYLHKRTGKAANKWHIRGYDAANVLLEAKGEGKGERADLIEGITLLDSIKLASINQTFSDMDIVGQKMRLLTIRNGSVLKEDSDYRRALIAPPVIEDSLAVEESDTLAVTTEGSD